MSNYQLKNDEVILFEGQVTYKEIKSEVKFILTNKKNNLLLIDEAQFESRQIC